MGDITFRVDADTGRAVQGFLALIDKQRQAERKFRDMGTAAKGAGRASKRTTDRMGKGLGNVTFQAGTLRGALDKVTEAYRFMSQEQDTSARKLEAIVEGTKRLVQVSTTMKESGELSGLARSIAASGVVDAAQAQEMVFAAKSVGLTRDLGTFTRAGMFMDPTSAIMTVGKLQAAFGEEAVGGSRRALNMVIGGAAQADVTVDKMAQASLVAAQASSRLGGTPEELMAFLSVLSPAMKSPETAAFRISRFASVLSRPIATQVVTPEAAAARARLAEIGVERRGIGARETELSTTAQAARLELDERELARGGVRDVEGRKGLRAAGLLQEREEMALAARDRALEEEARGLKPTARSTSQAIQFRGLGLLGALEKLQSLPTGVQQEILGGNMQVMEAYSAMLTNMQKLRSRTALLSGQAVPRALPEGAGSLAMMPSTMREDLLRSVDPFEQRYQIALGRSDLMVDREARRSKWMREQSDEAGARRRLAAEAARDRVIAYSKAKGESALLTWWRGKVGDFVMDVSGDPHTVQESMMGGEPTPPGHPVRRQTERQMVDKFDAAVDRYAEATDRMERVAEKLEKNPNPNAHVEGP